MMDNSSITQMFLDAVITHRFDLIMFVAGLVGYIVLFSARNAKAAKGVHKKLDTTFEDDSEVVCTDSEAEATAEVIETDLVAQTATTCLARVIGSMEHPDIEEHFACAQLDGFLEDYPAHPFTPAEVQTVLNFCKKPQADKSLASRLLNSMAPTEEWSVLSSFICFFLDSDQCEEACNIFEFYYATFFDIELDEDMEWRLLMAASKCGRQSLTEHFLQTSQSEAAKKVNAIQHWWRRASVQKAETRVAHMGDVLHRLSNMFNERFPFEEDSDDGSDGESTCFLGDDSDLESDSDSESTWEAMDW